MQQVAINYDKISRTLSGHGEKHVNLLMQIIKREIELRPFPFEILRGQTERKFNAIGTLMALNLVTVERRHVFIKKGSPMEPCLVAIPALERIGFAHVMVRAA